MGSTYVTEPSALRMHTRRIRKGSVMAHLLSACLQSRSVLRQRHSSGPTHCLPLVHSSSPRSFQRDSNHQCWQHQVSQQVLLLLLQLLYRLWYRPVYPPCMWSLLYHLLQHHQEDQHPCPGQPPLCQVHPLPCTSPLACPHPLQYLAWVHQQHNHHQDGATSYHKAWPRLPKASTTSQGCHPHQGMVVHQEACPGHPMVCTHPLGSCHLGCSCHQVCSYPLVCPHLLRGMLGHPLLDRRGKMV